MIPRFKNIPPCYWGAHELLKETAHTNKIRIKCTNNHRCWWYTDGRTITAQGSHGEFQQGIGSLVCQPQLKALKSKKTETRWLGSNKEPTTGSWTHLSEFTEPQELIHPVDRCHDHRYTLNISETHLLWVMPASSSRVHSVLSSASFWKIISIRPLICSPWRLLVVAKKRCSLINVNNSLDQ